MAACFLEVAHGMEMLPARGRVSSQCFPSNFFSGATHQYIFKLGSLRYAVHSGKIWAMYLENLVCSSFCPCTNQIICKAWKKEDLLCFQVDFLGNCLPECQSFKLTAVKKVCKSVKKCLYTAHIQYEAGLSQQVCPNTSRAPCRGRCSLLWKQGGPLLLCCLLAALTCSNTASSRQSFLFGDGAQLVGYGALHPAPFCTLQV